MLQPALQGLPELSKDHPPETTSSTWGGSEVAGDAKCSPKQLLHISVNAASAGKLG